jgi:hypothetical protein
VAPECRHRPGVNGNPATRRTVENPATPVLEGTPGDEETAHLLTGEDAWNDISCPTVGQDHPATTVGSYAHRF